MNAEVTVKFKLNNMCNQEDLEETGMTFEEMIRYLIKEEGLMGLTDDEGQVINIKEIK